MDDRDLAVLARLKAAGVTLRKVDGKLTLAGHGKPIANDLREAVLRQTDVAGDDLLRGVPRADP